MFRSVHVPSGHSFSEVLKNPSIRGGSPRGQPPPRERLMASLVHFKTLQGPGDSQALGTDRRKKQAPEAPGEGSQEAELFTMPLGAHFWLLGGL